MRQNLLSYETELPAVMPLCHPLHHSTGYAHITAKYIIQNINLFLLLLWLVRFS
jgi:hypothetical protein